MKTCNLLLLSLLVVIYAYTSHSFQLLGWTGTRRISQHGLLSSSSTTALCMTDVANVSGELEIGEYEGAVFNKVGGVMDPSSKIQRYRLEYTMKPKETNAFLNEYKGEMKRRKVIFPGFRPGVLPPYAMGDVRKYIVSYALELTIGSICNMNSLVMCSETGDQVPFGTDEFYEEIILDDYRGYNFTQFQSTWREGTDMQFTAEFFAMSEAGDDSDEDGTASSDSGDDNVIDAEVVSE